MDGYGVDGKSGPGEKVEMDGTHFDAPSQAPLQRAANLRTEKLKLEMRRGEAGGQNQQQSRDESPLDHAGSSPGGSLAWTARASEAAEKIVRQANPAVRP